MPTTTISRLSKAKYAGEALSGFGARLHAGRWHRKGLPMVYLTESPALALLEKFVHVNRPEELAGFDWRVISVEVEGRHVQRLPEADRPSDWDVWPWPAETQRLGSRWFEQQKSVVLEVPSAVVPRQRNYLLNPTHPQFEALEVGEPEHFPIDRRLITERR